MLETLTSLFPDFPYLLARAIAALQWLLLSAFYFFWLAVSFFFISLSGSGDLESRVQVVAIGGFIATPLVVILALSAWAFGEDKQREAAGADDFRDNWLFFRYGHRVNYAILSIPVKSIWSFEEVQASAEDLRADLAERIAKRLPHHAVQIMAHKLITDTETSEKKGFTRILIQSAYGSTVTVFIHYASFGQTITAHYFTYCRGTYDILSIVKFVLSSPFTIWFWGLPWLLNQFSIIAKISKFRVSSFDTIDLQTMYGVARRVIFEETDAMLKTAGLLTEELQRAIQYQLNQTVQISNASNFSVGDISQAGMQEDRPNEPAFARS
jgi:hypothetical protein